jgi:DnaJ-class molecular chaperone
VNGPDLFTAAGETGIMCQDCGRFYPGLAELADHFAGAGRHGSQCERNRATDEENRVIRLDIARRRRPVPCPECNGSSWVQAFDSRKKQRVVIPCPPCKGSGSVPGNVADEIREQQEQRRAVREQRLRDEQDPVG